MKIDSNIESNVNDFNFNEVANKFDEHVEKSIPLYNEIHNIVSDISVWFVENNTNVYDIGSSTGTFIDKLLVKHNNKSALQIFGIDTSQNMIDICSEKYINNKQIKILNKNILDVNIENSSFITTLFTMQFIKPCNRELVIKNIYDGLNKKGAFVLVEKIYAEESLTNDIWNQLYHDMKLDNGLTRDEIFNKDRAIRGVMKPNTHKENLDMLKSAGFNKIETFFQWCNFVGYLAVK